MEVTFKPWVALTLGAFAISIAAARFPCLRVHALDKDGGFGDGNDGDVVGDDYAKDGLYHRQMTKVVILVIWLVMPDADGFRDDANIDLYKKFVKIVISLNKSILSLRFLSLMIVSHKAL